MIIKAILQVYYETIEYKDKINISQGMLCDTLPNILPFFEDETISDIVEEATLDSIVAIHPECTLGYLKTREGQWDYNQAKSDIESCLVQDIFEVVEYYHLTFSTNDSVIEKKFLMNNPILEVW